MSLTSEFAAARRELSVFKTASCEVRSAASGWTSPGTTVFCHYEQTPPTAGGPLEYESGAGYGYTVWFDEPVAIAEQDIVAVNGIEIQVQEVPPTGNLTPVQRIEGAVRGG